MHNFNPQHVGSSFDDFMKEQHLTKTVMAEKMHTSRASLNRLLDEEDTSLTLTTLASAAAALGKTIRVELVSTPNHA